MAINRLTILFIIVVIKPQFYEQPSSISIFFYNVFFGCVGNEIVRYEVQISVQPQGSASISLKYMDHCSLATVYRSLYPVDGLRQQCISCAQTANAPKQSSW